MKKSSLLNQWLWKWHFIGGIISLPIVILLSITGILYLFKDQYEASLYQSMKEVPAQEHALPYQQQWEIAQKEAVKPPNIMVLPANTNEATEFVSGRFSGKSSLFVNPHDGAVNGEVVVKETDMYLVRKLHGELLTGKFGTKLVELVASWMVVLILTGLYIWWPKTKWKLQGLFTIRTKVSKRLMYRDMHAVLGFWCSFLLLLVLAGGLPWTDVFGDSFKWVQAQTSTGYPKTWSGRTLASEVNGTPLALDEMVNIARKLELPGTVNVHLPMSPKSVFSVSNKTSDLDAMQMLHFDQYSGEQILALTWADIGPLMQGRLWVMAFHQGEFGPWNWFLMLGTGIMLLVISVSALYAYLHRKQKGSWSVPPVPTQFKVGKGVVVLVILLGVVLPLFGLSVLLIVLYQQGRSLKRRINSIQKDAKHKQTSEALHSAS